MLSKQILKNRSRTTHRVCFKAQAKYAIIFWVLISWKIVDLSKNLISYDHIADANSVVYEWAYSFVAIVISNRKERAIRFVCTRFAAFV